MAGLVLSGEVMHVQSLKSDTTNKFYQRIQVMCVGDGPVQLYQVTDYGDLRVKKGQSVEIPVSVKAYSSKNGVAGLSFTHWGRAPVDMPDSRASGGVKV